MPHTTDSVATNVTYMSAADQPVRSANTVALMVMLWLTIAGVALWAPVDGRDTPPPAARTCIDPNTAPWWELSLLPRVGYATAQAVIDHRASLATDEQKHGPSFKTANDLQAVRGIGPKTAQRIRPFLCLPD